AFPFLAIGTLSAACGAAWFTHRGSGYVGRVRVRETGPGVTVVRDNIASPLLLGLVCFAFTAFMGLFPVLLAMQSVPYTAVPLHFTVAFAAGTAAYALRRRWLRQGRGDTVIDIPGKQLVPARGWAPTVDPVPLDRLEGVETVVEETRDGDGRSISWWTGVR